MKTSLSIKVFSLLLAGMMAFGLAACEDDEIPSTADYEEIVAPPTEDIIKNTVEKPYAVLGEDFDELTTHVLNRMTGKRYNYAPGDSYIADDVEVVFLDYNALTDLSEHMVYEIKEVFDRGGAIYLHKPNALALLFFHLTMYGQLDDFMEWLKEQMTNGAPSTRATQEGKPLERESYIMRRDSYLDVKDLYNGQEISTQVVNVEEHEDGSSTTTTVTSTFTPDEPSAYEYGLFAERVAKWLNQDNPAATRASGMQDLEQRKSSTTLVPCRLEREGDNKVMTCMAEINAWVSTLYNFNKKQDYYHIVVEEIYPSDAFYNEVYYKRRKKGSDYALVCAGYTYGGVAVQPQWNNPKHTLVKMWNPQPSGFIWESGTQSVSGWTTDQWVGNTNGVVEPVSPEYRFGILAYNTKDEILPTYIASEKQWAIDFQHKFEFKYEKNATDGGDAISNLKLTGIPETSSPTRSSCTTRQSWNWLVGNTGPDIKDPFMLDLKCIFYANGTRAITSGSHNSRTRKEVYNGIVSIALPIPYRFTKDYQLSTNCDKSSSEWESVEKFIKTSPTYRAIAKNKYCAPSEQELDKVMWERWNAVKNELANNLPAMPALTEEIEINLTSSNGNIGLPLRIGPNGMSVCKVGSYYMNDGSFLDPATELTPEQKENCVGVVCFLSDSEQQQKGINGYAMALHDANGKPCNWGDVSIFKSRRPVGRSGYENTQFIRQMIKENGRTVNEQEFPALYYATNYSVPLPPGAKGWFLPIEHELHDVAHYMDKECFEKVGGEFFHKEHRYTSSNVVLGYNIETGKYPIEVGYMHWQGPLDTYWRTWVEEPDKHEYHVRPFIAF